MSAVPASPWSGEPTRGDLRLILAAVQNDWPVKGSKSDIVEFVNRALTDGRSDRIQRLAAEVLDAMAEANERAQQRREAEAANQSIPAAT